MTVALQIRVATSDNTVGLFAKGAGAHDDAASSPETMVSGTDETVSAFLSHRPEFVRLAPLRPSRSGLGLDSGQELGSYETVQ